MRQRLFVTLDSNGLPNAQVPFNCMWDLVEYLSYQRVVAHYQYDKTYFTITFPRMDLESSQRILDEWVHAGIEQLQPA